MTSELMTVPDHAERAVATLPDTAGTLALASMSDAEFGTRLAALKRGRDRMATIQRELMDLDVDYGTIPGTPKPTLYKPGAEKLNDIYSLRADFIPERVIGDGVTVPTLAYQTRCELHLGTLDGPVVAVGYGSANSWERKHRYRRAERACPDCGVIGSLLRSKQGKAEWFCWGKRGGCGKTFRLDDPKVVGQPLGDVENPDPWDLDTTLLKMAEKRAHVDATLRGCAASGLFTQDVEDAPQPEPPDPVPAATIAERVEQRRATTSAPAASSAVADQGAPVAQPDRSAPAAEPSPVAPVPAGEGGAVIDGTAVDVTGEGLTPGELRDWLRAELIGVSEAREGAMRLFGADSFDRALSDAQRIALRDDLAARKAAG